MLADDDDDDTAAAAARHIVLPLPAVGECRLLACGRPAYAHGLCRRDYDRSTSTSTSNKNGGGGGGGAPKGVRRRTPRADRPLCEVEGCRSVQQRRRMCRHHYDLHLASARCSQPACPRPAYAEELCRRHFAERRGRCAHGACESTDIYCLSRMLCQQHYNREQRVARRRGPPIRVLSLGKKKKRALCNPPPAH
jgi:hypothetical protein